MEMICKSGEPDSKKKACVDCYYCRGEISWWCKNKKAIEWRGTSIPGVHNCPFWKAIRKKSDLKWYDRLINFLSYFYVDCNSSSSDT